MSNLERVYETALQSLVVRKPDGGSTVGRQVDVDYLYKVKFDFGLVLPCDLMSSDQTRYFFVQK